MKALEKEDADLEISVLDDGFFLKDPDYGHIYKSEYSKYFRAFRKVFEEKGGVQPDTYAVISSDIAFRSENGSMIAWVHWWFRGADMERASLLRIGTAVSFLS